MRLRTAIFVDTVVDDNPGNPTAKVVLLTPPSSIDLLHKSEKGVAFADKNLDVTDKSGRKCYAPTAKNRLLQEV